MKSYLSTVLERYVEVLALSLSLLPVLMLLSSSPPMTKATSLQTVNPAVLLAWHAVLPEEYSLDSRVEQRAL